MIGNTNQSKKRISTILIVLAVIAIVAFVCWAIGNGSARNNEDVSENVPVNGYEYYLNQHGDNANAVGDDYLKNENVNINENANNGSAETSQSNVSYEAHEWSAQLAPNGYKVWGEAIVDYNINPGEYHYAELDSLGRTGIAYAGITISDYQRELGEDREKFGNDANKLSGWGHNTKVNITLPNGKQYNGYAYNRSHLIADSIGGDPKRYNLVTGTRFQNVGDGDGGMVYAEEKARKWLESASASDFLYYAVTPVYVGDELVPRSVYVDMLSTDGTINEHIETFNVTGDISGKYSVDYATGYILDNGKKVEKK